MKKHRRASRVFVALSGGVDSSVAALLLTRQGYAVTGVFLSCYNVDGCAERDAEDARRVAEHMGIPFYVWNFEEEYERRVVRYMIDGYRRGETPNPDVECNREIKFGLFFRRARELGADYVATGHYVRRRASRATGHVELRAAKDANKDQSYFLWTLTQRQLARCLFPVGEYLKSEVRERAREARLPTAEKKDSQGICFLGRVNLGDFLEEYIPARRGVVVDTQGLPIGEHRGVQFYTVGQRHVGAKFPAQSSKFKNANVPWYVAEKDAKRNVLVVAEGEDDPALYRKEIALRDVNIVSRHPQHTNKLKFVSMSVWARVRYRQPLAKAQFVKRGPRAALIFDEPQKFVAAGQSAVIYSRTGQLLGGGVIA